MAKLNFGGTEENVVTREEFPLSKAQEVLKNEVVAVIGYGVQGRGQSLNMKDNGVNVIIGLRTGGRGWDLAQQDGWVPGKTLLSLEEAIQRGTIGPTHSFDKSLIRVKHRRVLGWARRTGGD